jgi:hypothetical protein
MSNNIAITIDVIDNDSSGKVGQVAANLEALGPAGQSGGAAAGAGLDQVGEHAVTSREQVRLLSEEMGLRVPRAMQSVIASSQMMSAAIGAIAPAMIAIGGVDILYHLGEGAYNAFEKYIMLRDAINDSNAAIARMGDASEAALNRASEATERYIRMTQGAAKADEYGLNRVENTPFKIPLYGDAGFQNSSDAMKGNVESITGESVMPKDLDATIEKLKAYETQQKGIIDIYKEFEAMGDPFRVYAREVDQATQALKNTDAVLRMLLDSQTDYVAEVKTASKQIDEDNKAKADAAIAKAKEKTDAITALENSARNAQLSGDALLEAQREEAIDSFVRKYGESREAILAIDGEYMQKESALWKQQSDEADKAMRAAQQAADQQAHTGVGSIQYELSQTLGEIDQKQSKGMQPGYANDERDAANQTSNTKILAAQKEFEDQMAQIGRHGDDQQIEGYARIAEKADESLKKVNAAWTAYEDKVRGAAGLTVDEERAKDAEILALNQNMLREMGQLHDRTMEQIGKEEEQTARYSLAEWQQTQLRIVDDYQDRVRKIQDLQNQQDAALDADMKGHAANVVADQQAEVMAAQDADAQMLAARRQMNAAMQQSDEETRDKLASGLQSLFSHPEQFFEKRAMDTAFQLMANQMLSVFKSSTPAGSIVQYLFGMGPQMATAPQGTRDNPLTDVESLFHLGGYGHAAGTAGLSSPASGTGASLQFQQGVTTFSTSSTTFATAVTQFASAAGTMTASGGLGVGGMGAGGLGGAGTSLLGLGGADVSTASGGGADFNTGGSTALSGLAGASTGLSTLGTFGNALALPGMAERRCRWLRMQARPRA